MDRCRATTSTGAVVDQPSVVQLADLVAEVDRCGRDAFLVVERRSGDSYLQARRSRDGWVLELHDGTSVRRNLAETADAALVYSTAAYWLTWSRAWPGLAWSRGHRPAVSGPEHLGLATAV